jgi:tRNA threonylcarbamoyl adenosine modification protein YeaZ
MRLLLDSSGAELVCALADGEGVYLEERCPTRSAESRDIGAVVGRLLGETKIAELEAVIVGTGPGSFIGTRVAISYANGLTAAGGVALYGVNSLAAIGAVYCHGHCVVLRDARRQEVYWYGPCGIAQAEACCMPLAIADLGLALAKAAIGTVVFEEPQPGQARSAETRAGVLAALSAAGVEAVVCNGVPAEGLRRMQASAARVEYIEPVYLRGFL